MAYCNKLRLVSLKFYFKFIIMTKKFFNAVIEIRDSHKYYLATSEKRIVISIKNMHKMCDFSGLTDSKGLIRPGTKLHLVEIGTENGLVYYPDHRYYKSQNNNCEKSTTIRRNINSVGTESEKLEFKSSFSNYCMPGIIETIAAFANSGHEGSLIIGVDDAGIPIGLWNIHNKNDKKLIEDNIRNRAKQHMGLPLSRSLIFEWSESFGKCICTINVPKWSGDLLFINGNKLYIRMGSTNQLLKDTDMVDFIKNRQAPSQTTTRYPLSFKISNIG